MTRYLNFCSVCAVTVVIFGHLNRSLYLLTYLLDKIISGINCEFFVHCSGVRCYGSLLSKSVKLTSAILSNKTHSFVSQLLFITAWFSLDYFRNLFMNFQFYRFLSVRLFFRQISVLCWPKIKRHRLSVNVICTLNIQ